jgi:hypothetical protein
MMPLHPPINILEHFAPEIAAYGRFCPSVPILRHEFAGKPAQGKLYIVKVELPRLTLYCALK